MSLLMNEDFSVYQLRLGYLNHIHDGVGERLINLNPSVLNNPAFRTAGWVADTSAIKRCYSPPIPTSGGPDISSEYFQRPRRPTGRALADDDGAEGGGMVTGHPGSEDTLGPGGLHANERKRERRRRKEQLEEDDSSDLSDDSDEDDMAKGPAQSIKFSKMPIRHRAKSSPPTRGNTLRADFDDGPALMVTSPSRPSEMDTFNRIRSESMGQVDVVKQRARRDTTTSSEMSSENEGAPTAFKKKLPGRPGKGPSVLTVDDDIQEEEHDGQGPANSDLDDEDEDDIDVGEASDLSDDAFDGTADSPSLLGLPGASDGMSTSPLKSPPSMLPAVSAASTSPKKHPREALPRLPRLPLGERPLSMHPQQHSLISMMIKGSGGVSDKPFQQFAELSGKDQSSPLWIKIYAPFADTPTKAIEVPLRRVKENRPVTVAELIGLALWRYVEEGYKPGLKSDESSINNWTLRIVEDEEIDFDFPALVRTRPVVDFTSNNNNPPRRSRDKPWDEFGLVKATEEQFKENEELTPQIGEMGSTGPPALPMPKFETTPKFPVPPPFSRVASEAPPTPNPNVSFNPSRNPITGPSFAPNALRKDSSALLDLPQRETRQGAQKTGAPRIVVVTFTDPQSFSTRNESYETTADSYIAEIFEKSCARLGLDRALYNLKVHGTQTVAPLDRTIEALGGRMHLDLVRRRFAGSGMTNGDGLFGLGLSGSPGSSSPNAPLDLTPANATPGHTKKKGMKGFNLHPLAAQQKIEMNTTSQLTLALDRDGKRYNVLRKQPLSFAQTHPRTLIITPEYMTIMPAAPDSLAAPTGKVTNVPMTSVIGAKVSRKHSKMVRILVFREKEPKRYDFEASNHREAEEIVSDVRRGMEAFGPARVQ